MKRILLFIAILNLPFCGFAQDGSHSSFDFRERPALLWTYKTHQPLFSSPLIENNTVYCGSLDSNWYAIDLSSGKLKWKYATNGEIRSTAVLQDHQIIFLSGDGKLYSLDKNTGKLIWTFSTGGEQYYPLYSYADYYHSSPVYAQGTIYFGSGDSSIYAVNANNGKLLWQYKTGSVVHARPAVQNNQLYVGSFDGLFYALDATTGALIWKFKSVGQHYFPKGEMQGNPVFFADKVYVGSRDFNFYAMNAKEGYCHWNLQFPKGWAMGTPVIKDSVLYVGTSDDMVLLALDPFSGKTKWKAAVKFNVFGAPALTESMVYVGTLMGKIFGIDRSTGEIRWHIETASYQRNRRKYFTEKDVYRDDIQTVIRKGEDFLTMYYELGGVFSTPAIANDKLVITSTDGNIYCFRKK